MPKSLSFSLLSSNDDEHLQPGSRAFTNPPSPVDSRPSLTSYSTSNLRSYLPNRVAMEQADEHTRLLVDTTGQRRRYVRSGPTTPGAPTPSSRSLSRQQSMSGSLRPPRRRLRTPSATMRLSAIIPQPKSGPGKTLGIGPVIQHHQKSSGHQDDRIWYDQFTSTDWVHDSIADGYRIREMQKRRDLRGRLWLWFDSAQGWILVALIGCCVAFVAYFVDITESAIFDLKEGHCQQNWAHNKIQCCNGRASCEEWHTWSKIIHPQGIDSMWIDYFAFTVGCVVLATISCYLTLYSKDRCSRTYCCNFRRESGCPSCPQTS